MVAVLDNRADSQLGLFAHARGRRSGEAAVAARKGVLGGRGHGPRVRLDAAQRPRLELLGQQLPDGKPPPAFDILYWNNDTTRLPAELHAELLDIFVDNLFTTPGSDRRCSARRSTWPRSTCDKYFVAGITDHITPWKGVYNTAQLVRRQERVRAQLERAHPEPDQSAGQSEGEVLAEPGRDARDPTAGSKAPTRYGGSWWEHWREWLAARSGARRKRQAALGNAAHPPLEAAPGRYVREP